MKNLFFLVALITHNISFSQNVEENISSATLDLIVTPFDSSKKALNDFHSCIYIDDVLIRSQYSQLNTEMKINLYLQNEYKVLIIKQGFDTTQILFDTRMSKEEEKKGKYGYIFDCKPLLTKINKDEVVLREIGKIYFDSNSGFFDFDDSYVKLRATTLSKQGASFLDKQEYKMSEQYLTRSIAIYPTMDSYYNRAIARINQENFVGFCEDLKSASGLGDEEAVKLLQEKCYKSDTLYFNQDSVICKKGEHSYSMYYRKSKFSNYKFIMYRNNKDSIKLAYTDKNNERIYSHVDTFPKMGTEKNEFYNFLAKNIRYPPLMKEKGIQGTVFVSFIVETDGSISDIDIIESPDEMLSEEVLRLLKQMPTWKPAIYRGIPIKFELVLPIRFSLR